MVPTLNDYRDVAPPGSVEILERMAKPLKGVTLAHVNSTRYGGGVAEILARQIPLMEELGIKVRWEVIEGRPAFFAVTKAFHNTLQGTPQKITDEMLQEYLECNRENARRVDLESDLVIIHDPQPAPLIDYCRQRLQKKGKWIWRCHIDLSRPVRRVWGFLRQFVVKYDGAIFSLPAFAQKLPIPQYLISPSIDPLSEKNRELTREEIDRVFERLKIPRDKPILLQVSRYDWFKDPIGVIQAYQMVKKRKGCRLVLAGGGAADDPEGKEVLERVREAAGDDPDCHVLELPPDAHHEINALQRGATIVLQKSTKEGFGLTVAEAMWKGKPVIGGAVGGINTQIVWGVTGYTVNSVEGAAFRIFYLLNNPGLMKEMGKQAREFARQNLIVSRHLRDYLTLMTVVLRRGETAVSLR